MVCLSWPIGLKLSVLRLLLFVIIVIFLVIFLHSCNTFFVFYYSDADMTGIDKCVASEAVSFLYLVFGILYFICYYWILRKYVRIIATPKW